MTNPIPPGYRTVQPYLYIDGAADAIDFYKDVFGATERMRMEGPPGKVGHAELDFGGCIVMVADEFPDMGAKGPKHYGGSATHLMLYLPDVDGVVDAAVVKGATVTDPVEDKFYGDRAGQIEDPWGHRWTIATHVEDVSPEEMERRAAEAMAQEG